MKKLKNYRVFGNFNGRSIDINVDAFSKKQAKLKAGFMNGFGGDSLRKFFKKMKVR